MSAIVGTKDRVVGRHVYAVRPREQAFAPGPEEVPLPIENDHRVFAAIEYIDIVVTVDADRAHFVERPSVREFSPTFLDLISMVARAQNDRHVVPSLCA